MKRFGLLVVLVVAMTMVGCGGGKTSGMPGAGKTPEETIINMAAAAKAGDAGALKSCYKTNEYGEKAIELLAAMGKISTAFKEKMERAYGKEAAAVFREGPWALDVTPEGLATKIDGNTATVCVQRRQNFSLVKEGGVWLIADEEIQTMTDKKLEKGRVFVTAVQNAMKGVFEEIGKEGVTPEDIQTKLEKALEAAMGAEWVDIESESDAMENVRLVTERMTMTAVQVYIAQNNAMPAVADLEDMIEFDSSMWEVTISGTKDAPQVKVKARE